MDTHAHDSTLAAASFAASQTPHFYNDYYRHATNTLLTPASSTSASYSHTSGIDASQRGLYSNNWTQAPKPKETEAVLKQTKKLRPQSASFIRDKERRALLSAPLPLFDRHVFVAKSATEKPPVPKSEKHIMALAMQVPALTPMYDMKTSASPPPKKKSPKKQTSPQVYSRRAISPTRSRRSPSPVKSPAVKSPSKANEIIMSGEPLLIRSPQERQTLIQVYRQREFARFGQYSALTEPRVVYDSNAASKRQLRKDPDSDRETLVPFYTPKGDDDFTLVFESRFESGNLHRAIQIDTHEYDLLVEADSNTLTPHTQWFYFEVKNMRKDAQVVFHIVNFQKPNSLYNEGMQPVVYSKQKHATSEVGWHRAGDRIAYYDNNMRRKRSKDWYTLSFQYTFEHDHDTVYFAYSFPYTYTDLQRDLNVLEGDPVKSAYLRRRTLCTTLAGNKCDVLTITDYKSSTEEIKQRRAIVVSARVHPGESNSSYMVRGVLNFLLSAPSNPLAMQLLRTFVFKVVPMLNPDGVISGNYRCSLAGVDLNRVWHEPLVDVHPTIYHTKKLIADMVTRRDVFLCMDLHGHSRKMNIFVYGCEQLSDEDPRARKFISRPYPRDTSYIERVFPRIMHKVNMDQKTSLFSYRNSNFVMNQQKRKTMRVVVCTEYGLANIFTLEASFGGATCGEKAGLHYSSLDYEQVGGLFCHSLLEYCDPHIQRETMAAISKVRHAQAVLRQQQQQAVKGSSKRHRRSSSASSFAAVSTHVPDELAQEIDSELWRDLADVKDSDGSDASSSDDMDSGVDNRMRFRKLQHKIKKAKSVYAVYRKRQMQITTEQAEAMQARRAEAANQRSNRNGSMASGLRAATNQSMTNMDVRYDASSSVGDDDDETVRFYTSHDSSNLRSLKNPKLRARWKQLSKQFHERVESRVDTGLRSGSKKILAKKTLKKSSVKKRISSSSLRSQAVGRRQGSKLVVSSTTSSSFVVKSTTRSGMRPKSAALSKKKRSGAATNTRVHRELNKAASTAQLPVESNNNAPSSSSRAKGCVSPQMLKTALQNRSRKGFPTASQSGASTPKSDSSSTNILDFKHRFQDMRAHTSASRRDSMASGLSLSEFDTDNSDMGGKDTAELAEEKASSINDEDERAAENERLAAMGFLFSLLHGDEKNKAADVQEDDQPPSSSSSNKQHAVPYQRTGFRGSTPSYKATRSPLSSHTQRYLGDESGGFQVTGNAMSLAQSHGYRHKRRPQTASAARR